METVIDLNKRNAARRRSKYETYDILKRVFDILFSAMFLILFGGVILVLAFIKFCEDGHNPFYVSERIGIRGKKIKFHKIRSMSPNADKLKQTLIDKGLNEADGPTFKMKDDPRITKFGKFLRKTSLDELPQMGDVFCGRLSLVGPRSPVQEEVDRYTPSQGRRLEVKGGLVCLWQLTPNRNSMSFERWLALDLTYICNRSLWYDFKILVKSIGFVLIDHSGE